jgi:hypothetical protein
MTLDSAEHSLGTIDLSGEVFSHSFCLLRYITVTPVGAEDIYEQMPIFFCLQRMLGHIHALQQICLVQLVQRDHCKFQVRDDQYTCNVLGNVQTKNYWYHTFK